MWDDWKELLELAHQSNAVQTEYLISKRIFYLAGSVRRMDKELKEQSYRTDPYDARDTMIYDRLKAEQKDIETEANELKNLLTMLRI